VRREKGSATVELVILTPVLVALVMFVVYLGRYSAAIQTVQQAADHGARSASKTAMRSMHRVGTDASLAFLEQRESGCTDTRVNVAVDDDSARPSVLVEIECTINGSGLDLLGIAPRQVRAESLEVIDIWRARE
jgi:Flp pilus assembly protein TadG